MTAEELWVEMPNGAADGLKLLVQVIDDPRAKATTRLEAVRLLKKRLLWLKHALEAPHTAPDLRSEIIAALRIYWLS
jgi:hypothetical protein